MCPRVNKVFVEEKYDDGFQVGDEEKKWYDRCKWPTSSHYGRKYGINQDRTMSKWNGLHMAERKDPGPAWSVMEEFGYPIEPQAVYPHGNSCE